MRLFFVVSLLSIVFLSRGQNKIDVLHYRYQVELNDSNDTIYGNAEITLLTSRVSSLLKLDLAGLNANGNGMIVDSVKSTKHGNTIILSPPSDLRPLSYSKHTGDELLLRYAFDNIDPAQVNIIDTLLITISYHGIPSDGLIISKNRFGKRCFFADNWPNRAHNWIPCVDDPADKASVEFIVTAPSHYQVVSNGIRVAETNLPGNKKLTHYKENLPLPTKVMVIGVANFAVKKVADVKGVPVYSWVFPENKKKGFYDYAVAKDILAFFINYIGPFPFKKLANVQSTTVFGGMENASAIFYSENSVTGDRQEELLIAHEIAHQWFGDMATEKSFAHLWLSEGFADYLTHLYEEAKYGTDRLNNKMRNEREEIIDFVKTSQLPVVDSVSPHMQLLNINSYQKGSWVLHMLRRQLGDSIFQKSIRTYYESYAGKNADSRDLQKIFESVSGKDLEKFFTQWLYTPGILNLDITWSYSSINKEIYITINQIQKTGIFEFPLEILVQETETSIPKKIVKTIKWETAAFTFPVNTKPFKIIVDPLISLLFEGTVEESD